MSHISKDANWGLYCEKRANNGFDFKISRRKQADSILHGLEPITENPRDEL
jgi:hypothetical protein